MRIFDLFLLYLSTYLTIYLPIYAFLFVFMTCLHICSDFHNEFQIEYPLLQLLILTLEGLVVPSDSVRHIGELDVVVFEVWSDWICVDTAMI